MTGAVRFDLYELVLNTETIVCRGRAAPVVSVWMVRQHEPRAECNTLT